MHLSGRHFRSGYHGGPRTAHAFAPWSIVPDGGLIAFGLSYRRRTHVAPRCGREASVAACGRERHRSTSTS